MTIKYQDAVKELTETGFVKFTQTKQGTAWEDIANAVIAQIVNPYALEYVVCSLKNQDKARAIIIERMI